MLKNFPTKNGVILYSEKKGAIEAVRENSEIIVNKLSEIDFQDKLFETKKDVNDQINKITDMLIKRMCIMYIILAIILGVTLGFYGILLSLLFLLIILGNAFFFPVIIFLNKNKEFSQFMRIIYQNNNNDEKFKISKVDLFWCQKKLFYCIYIYILVIVEIANFILNIKLFPIILVGLMIIYFIFLYWKKLIFKNLMIKVIYRKPTKSQEELFKIAENELQNL